MSGLTSADFGFLSELLRDESGMVLERGKEYLVTTRLRPVAKRHGLADLGEVVKALRARDRALRDDVVEAMTVNETSWFRDAGIWNDLGQKLLPDLISRRSDQRRLDIWVSASSSGQEAYTLAMIVHETLGADVGSWKISILATDLSRAMVRRTSEGIYSHHEVTRGLSERRRQQFGQPCADGWQVNDELKSLVQARQLNLTAPRFAVSGPFDLILTRNVLIYFAPEMRRRILERQAALLSPGGQLIVGASESSPTMTGLAPTRLGSLVSYGPHRDPETASDPTDTDAIPPRTASPSALMSATRRPKPSGAGPERANRSSDARRDRPQALRKEFQS